MRKTYRDKTTNAKSTAVKKLKGNKQMYRRILVLFLALAFASILTAWGRSAGSTISQSTAATGQRAAPTIRVCPTPASGLQIYSIDAKQSQASYEVQEQFLSKPLPNQARGKTSSVQGGLALQSKGTPTITALKITVNVQTLTSDSSQRDDAIRGNWLQSNTYPLATFVVTTPQAATSGTYTNGQQVTFNLAGKMTVHNTTHAETFIVQGKLDGNTIMGTAKSQASMKDFGFAAPNLAGLLTVNDSVLVTFNFTAHQGGCPQLR